MATRKPQHPNPPPTGDEQGGQSRKSFRQRFEEHIWGDAEETQGFQVFAKRWLQIMDRAFVGFHKNKCFETASALTYTTILTIVPLLAILLAVLKGFGVHQSAHEALKKLPFVQALKVEDFNQAGGGLHIRLNGFDESTTATQSATEETTGTQSLPLEAQEPVAAAKGSTAPTTATQSVRGGRDAPPASPRRAPRSQLTGEQVADQIFIFVENTDISKLGFFGVLGLLWAVMMLMSRIEDAMNAAWAVHRSRTLARKLSDYLNMLVIVMLMLAGLSMTVTVKVSDVTGVFGQGGIKGLGEFVIKSLPYLIVWPAFIFMYYYIPNTRVKLKSALVSGLVAGTLFQILQVVFIRTQILVGNYNKIYGIFAIVLIMLVWAYFSWCTMLWGAEVCSAHQNLRDWRRRRRLWLGTPAERETLALRMAALLASPLLGRLGSKRMDAGDLADTLMLPLEPVGEMIDLFQVNGLLIQSAEDGAYIFARSPDSVTVLDLLRLVRQGTLAPPSGAHGLLSQIAGEITTVLKGQTVKDLVELPMDDIKTLIF